MKKLTLKNPSYRHLESGYREWLDILGYAPATVYAFPNYVREFLYYLEKQGYNQIEDIDSPVIHQYYRQLCQRRNQVLGGGLSNNYLNSHRIALDKFAEYLRKQARILLASNEIKSQPRDASPVTPLSVAQIKSLYRATENYEARKPLQAMTDRAILSVYYDCGLRKTEGIKLEVSDINYDHRLVHVRHGKGSKERFVPFSKATARRLEAYQYEARPQLLHSKQDIFLVNLRGNIMNGTTLNRYIRHMQQHTEDPTLQQMRIHLHLLRHSIATHLLYQGMDLEKVAQFLGHRTLESTQIYTHLMEEVNG